MGLDRPAGIAGPRPDQRGRASQHAVSGSRQRVVGIAGRRRLPRDGDGFRANGRWRMKCLIVDDEQPARERMRRLLAAHPEIVECGEARDGLEALRKIDELRPDLLFLDIELPGLSGFEVLRSLPRDIPPPLVIFVTGYDQHALAAFEANALAYLLKPVETERLAQAVERARKLGAGSQQSAAKGSDCGASRTNLREIAAADCLPQTRSHDAARSRADSLVSGGRRHRKGAHRGRHFLGECATGRVGSRSAAGTLFFRARREVLVNLSSIKEIRPYFKSGFLLLMADAAATEIVVSERQAQALPAAHSGALSGRVQGNFRARAVSLRARRISIEGSGLAVRTVGT